MKLSKVFNIRNVIIAGLIIWVIYSQYCNAPVAPIEKPQVKSVKEQAEVVRVDSIASALFKDSVNKIIGKWQSEAQRWESNWNREVLENRELQDTLGAWLSTTVPDTCREYQRKALEQYNKLAKINQSKDNSAAQTIRAKDNIINQKDVLISKHKEDYTKLRINLDTCFAQQTKLEKYIDKVKPKREFIAGITANTNYNIFKPEIGLTVGFRNRKGIQLNVSVYTNQQISLSLTKPLFRF